MTLGSLLPFALMFAVIYFVMLRPQIKQQKAHNAMLENLKEGDRVATRGGLVGRITKIENEEQLIIDTSGTKVTLLKAFVSHIILSKKDKPKEIKKD